MSAKPPPVAFPTTAARRSRLAAGRLRPTLDSAAAVERGTRIATLRRNERDELRVTLTEWEGESYVCLRVWRNTRGRWFPDPRRGLTVRIRELADLLDGLAAAVDFVTVHLANRTG